MFHKLSVVYTHYTIHTTLHHTLHLFYPTPLYMHTTGDQVKMQGIEAMQKQLMIREKRRAAARLEKQASEFDDKKRSIQELNDTIAERRLQLLEEQKILKKRFEPDNYEVGV